MPSKIRWGILSTGNIARQFASGLALHPEAELVAVGSRTEASAAEFAAQFGVARHYASYTALAQDPDLDVIYVATPHNLHCENTLLCLQAGKAVLCEKPFAINAAQTQAMIAEARQRKLFLMDAIWTRFLPIMVKLRHLLADGAIGEVRQLQADFSFRTAFDPHSRLFDPALGGGALLDVGIYPLSLASMIFGPPSEIRSLAQLGQTGVDEQSAMLLGYPQGELALISAATRTPGPQVAHILGTEGRIEIPRRWWMPERMTLIRPDHEPEEFHLPIEGNGYQYEAAAVHHSLQHGQLENAIIPLDETLSLMQTLDSIRAQWGLVYPMEQEN